MRSKKKKSGLACLVGSWEGLLSAVAANADELGHVAVYRDQLETEVADYHAVRARRIELQVEVMQATQELKVFRERGRDLAARLRAGIRLQYGFRSRKLVEFGMRPSPKRKLGKEKPEAQPAQTEAPRNPTAP